MSPTPVRARNRRATMGAAVGAAVGAVAPRREERPRPPLRLVDDAALHAAQRRRRARLLFGAAVVGACFSLFALAGAHALLVSGQVRLDRLEEQVGEEQARYQSLRLEAAELESPARIVAEAQTRLGMVPPPSIVYLTPTGPSQPADPAPPPDGRADGSGGEASWAAIKPYLGERP